MQSHKIKQNTEENKGFTLLELSFVIIIIGIMLIPLINAIDRYYEQRKHSYTKTALNAAVDMVREYKVNRLAGAYPCPAKRGVSVDSVEYGVSVDCSDLPALGLVNPGDCVDGLCLAEVDVAGPITTPSPAQDKDGITGTDFVVIGAFPVRTIQQAAANGEVDFRTADLYSTRMDLDGWDNQFTYAVTQSLTVSGNRDRFWYGVMYAKDEFGANTAGTSGDAHFVVLSHGPNKRGAYNQYGQQTVPCNANSITTLDDENCDDDATFVQSLAIARTQTANAYDDYVRFAKETSVSLWKEDQGENKVYFVPNGNLAINMPTADPSVALEVNGVIKAENTVLTTKICDDNPYNSDGSVNTNARCFNPNIISGDYGTNCASTELLKGYKNGSQICETPVYQPLTTTDCGPSGWVHGIKTNGEVICYP